jgi:hypothetical protein
MMNHSTATERSTFSYAESAQPSCVLCGSDTGMVFFRGKLVCEDCLSFVKGLY